MPNDGQLAGSRILVIEDDFPVGEIILLMLEDEGAQVLGPVGSVDEALAFIAEQAQMPDRVVLDLNLHGVKSYPVADALTQRTFHLSSSRATAGMRSMKHIGTVRTASSRSPGTCSWPC